MIRMYFDTNIHIYSFDGKNAFGQLALTLVGRATNPANKLFGSVFILGELLVKPLADRDEFQQARIHQFFKSPLITLLPFPSTAAVTFAELRASRVKALDAIHLACAAHAGVDLFVTNDKALTALTVPGIGRVVGMEAAYSATA